MADYNVTDIGVRLAKLRRCIEDEAYTLSKHKKYGTSTVARENKFLLLIAYEWIIREYRVGSTLNEITEVELDHIFNMIQRLCNLAFAPKGYSYFNNEPVDVESAILLNDSSNLLLNDSTNILLNN